MNEIGRLASIHMIILCWKLIQQTQESADPARYTLCQLDDTFLRKFSLYFHLCLFFHQHLSFLMKNICPCFTDIIKVIILHCSVSNACPFPLECKIQSWSLHCSVLICNCKVYDLGKHSHRLPWWLRGKETACQAGDSSLIPGSRRSSGGGHGNPLQYSCLRNSMERGAWRARVHGVAKSQTWLSD